MHSIGGVERGVGDIRDMNLWVDGRMERCGVPILPPPGAGKVPRAREKGMRKW